MAILYSEARAGLQDIANNLAAANQRLDRIRQELDRIKTAIADIESKHASTITEIDSLAASRSKAVWTDAKDQKDELVANISALRSRADGMIAAIDAL